MQVPPRSVRSCASVLPALLLALPPSRPADPAGRATASPATAPRLAVRAPAAISMLPQVGRMPASALACRLISLMSG